jgi:hypothetical protein
MPTSTYVALATTTLGATAASVTFSSIPATYRDLVLVYNGTTSANIGVDVEFNGDTNSANYSRVFMYAPPVELRDRWASRNLLFFYRQNCRNLPDSGLLQQTNTKQCLSRMGCS